MLIRNSKPAKEIPDGNFYRFCDTQQGFNGNNFLSAFNLADIFGVQIHRFSQVLLSEIGSFAIQADSIADDFSMPKNRLFLPVGHSPRIADTSLLLTPATCWYFVLAIRFAALNDAEHRYRFMNPGNPPSATVTGKGTPDVIVTRADQTTVFKMQNRRVSEWLRKHFNSTTGNAKGDTQIYVHPTRCKRIIEELKGAGFLVARKEENQ